MKKTLLFSFLLSATAGLQAQTTVCTSFWRNGAPVSGTNIDILLNAPGAQPVTVSAEGVGCASIQDAVLQMLPAGSTLGYTGAKAGDDRNGITVLDLVATSSHILGIYPLNAPFALFAADVNKSGSVTAFDIVESRKLLLGIYEAFPNNTSWRFFQSNCMFPTPANPFQNSCPPFQVSELLAAPMVTLSLTGVKVGDVDGDAGPDGPFTSVVTVDSTQLDIPNLQLVAGVPTTIDITLAGTLGLTGLQAAFLFDSTVLHFNGPEATGLFPLYSYGISSGKILSVATSPSTPFVPGDLLMKLNFTANTNVLLSDVFGLNTSTAHSLGALGLAPPQGIKLGTTVPELSGFSWGGNVTGTAEVASGHLLSAPSPNPFSGETTFTLQLKTPETVRLEIFDAHGKRLHFYENRLPAGTHALTVGRELLSSTSVCYYRLQAGNQWKSGKVVKG